jgi:hypothetical protein
MLTDPPAPTGGFHALSQSKLPVWDYGPRLRCRPVQDPGARLLNVRLWPARPQTSRERRLSRKGGVTWFLRATFRETKLAVFVLDTRQKPLMPCCAKRARVFLTGGRAVGVGCYPFTTTGIAVVTEEDRYKPAKVVCLFEPRGRRISQALTACRPFGFPRGYGLRTKSVHGFKTGDMVRAEVRKGRRKGEHDGRVAVRDSHAFNRGKAQHINRKHCRLLQRAGGSAIAVPVSAIASFTRTGLSCRLAPTVAIGRV